jgi:hypothetical protein
MRCPSCNQEIPDAAKFCGYCGYRIEAAPPPPPPPAPTARKGGIPTWLWLIVGLVVVAAVVWFTFLGPRQPMPQPVEEADTPTSASRPTPRPTARPAPAAITDPGQTCQYIEDGSEVRAAWRSSSVTIDGRITNEQEWADAACINGTLDEADWLTDELKKGTVFPSRWWFMNDGERLYVLVRISTMLEDKAKLAGINYFYGDESDTGSVERDGEVYDDYGWDGERWYADEEASPPGEINVEGAASEYGSYYWFEFAKDLDSGDGYDWSFGPGDVMGEDDTALSLLIDGAARNDWGELFFQLILADGP